MLRNTTGKKPNQLQNNVLLEMRGKNWENGSWQNFTGVRVTNFALNAFSIRENERNFRMSRSYNSLQVQRFLFYTLLPEAHSANQAGCPSAPGPSQRSRGEQSTLSFLASPVPSWAAANQQSQQHPPSTAARAGSALPSIPSHILSVRRIHLC